MDNNADTLLLAFSQGGKAGAVQKCVACRGRGMRIMIRQLAPGMVQQMQSVCTDCNGEGNVSPHTCKLTFKNKVNVQTAAKQLSEVFYSVCVVVVQVK